MALERRIMLIYRVHSSFGAFILYLLKKVTWIWGQHQGKLYSILHEFLPWEYFGNVNTNFCLQDLQMQPLFSLFFPSSLLRMEFTMIKEIIAAWDIINQFLPTMFGSFSSFYIKYLYKICMCGFAYLCHMMLTYLSMKVAIITVKSGNSCIFCL